jgi:formylglycine-generating enzyme required for sulfatase activity
LKHVDADLASKTQNLSPEQIQTILESIWKLYVEKQIISVEANNSKALPSTHAKASQLQQLYNDKITEAQGKIHDFITVWNEFKKQKMQQQSRSTREQAAEESRRRKLESEEEERRRLHEALDSHGNYRKAKFHEISPGSFLMGDEQVPTEITKPFAMMDTQVTQMMWARIMIAIGETDPDKINPSEFKTGLDSTLENIEGIEVEMQGNHPVEQVSWDDIVNRYIEGLNHLSSHGDLKTQALLETLFPGHQKGDIYDLPTEAQWEFVMRDRGQANKKHFDRDDETEVPKHAWFEGNSKSEEYPDGSTHAVASRKPRMIDVNGDEMRHPFYDLEGNVRELMKDYWDGISQLPGGKDPLGTSGSFRVFRGGSWLNDVQYLRSGYREIISPGIRFIQVGFRLVRTRP